MTLALATAATPNIDPEHLTYSPAGAHSGAGYQYGERITVARNMLDRSHVVATLEIRRPDDPGRGLSPGFSLTGEVYEAHGTWSGAARKRNGREWDRGGQCVDAILAAFPWLAPFAAVHLTGLDGAPSYDGANAVYYYGGVWLDYARKACADAQRDRFGIYHGELLYEGETYDGDRHYATVWDITGDENSSAHVAVPGFHVREWSGGSSRIIDTVSGPMTWAEIAHVRAARQLRMDPDDLPRGLEPIGFANLVADQRERWAYEAHDAQSIFDSLRTQALEA